MTRGFRLVGLIGSAVIGLAVLHNDAVLLRWFGHETWPQPLLWGWLPFDLVYHTAWAVLGVGVTGLVVRHTWGRHP